MVAVAVPERRVTSTHRTSGLPFHSITPPLRRFSCSPIFNCPRGDTIDAGMSYVTTAQPDTTQVASLEKMGRPRITRVGRPPTTSAWERQAGSPTRALTHSECTCVFLCTQPGIVSVCTTSGPDLSLPAVVCAKNGPTVAVSFSDGWTALSRAARTSWGKKVISACPGVIDAVPGTNAVSEVKSASVDGPCDRTPCQKPGCNDQVARNAMPSAPAAIDKRTTTMRWRAPALAPGT